MPILVAFGQTLSASIREQIGKPLESRPMAEMLNIWDTYRSGVDCHFSR